MSFEQGTGGVGWGNTSPPAVIEIPHVPGTGASAPGVPGYPGYPGGGGAFTMPSWGSLSSSPFVIAANALAQQQLSALKAQMGSSAARALVNLGDASLAKQVGNLNLPKGVGQSVEDANAAGTSVLSQLLHQHTLNEQSIPARLAGRGFYRSGQTGYTLGEENRSYGNQQYKARQSTLDYLNGLYSQYMSQQFQIQQAQQAAYMQAYQSALSVAMMQAQLAGQVYPTAGPTYPTGGGSSSSSLGDLVSRLGLGFGG